MPQPTKTKKITIKMDKPIIQTNKPNQKSIQHKTNKIQMKQPTTNTTTLKNKEYKNPKTRTNENTKR